MTHEIKIWPQFLASVLDGTKPFEVRRNDRNYQRGDYLRMREWNPKTKKFGPTAVTVLVTHMLENHPGLVPGHCVMGTQITKVEHDLTA